MIELNKNKRLTIVVVAIVAVILIGLVTIQKPAISYKLTYAQTLEALRDTSAYITPLAVAELLKTKDAGSVLIDVRNSLDYNKTHYENTLNIPVREIFKADNLKKIKDIIKGGQNIVLIGESQQQAIGPWMMLKQIGIDKVKVFTGVYSQLALPASDSLVAAMPQNTETPILDISALKKTIVSSDGKAEMKPVVKKTVTPKKAGKPSGGGC